MKNLYSFLTSGIFLLLGITNAQAQCERIAFDTTIVSGPSFTISLICEYKYNDDDQLICILRSSLGSLVYRDSIYYDAVSGKVDSLVRFNGSGSVKSGDFLKNTWTSGNLTRQVNHYSFFGPVNKDTSNYTYSGSTLTAFTMSHFDGNNTTLSEANSIVYTGGNISSCNYSYGGSPLAASTVEFDSYANPFYNLPIFNDALVWSCQNNVITAYADIAPEAPYFTYTLSYYDDITKLARTNRPYNQVTASIRYAWDCQIVTSVFNPTKTEEVGFAPNPSAEGIFRLDNSKGEHYDEVFVSNAEGKILFSLTNVSDNQIIIDLSSAKSGLYIATLKNSKGVKVARLVK